MKVREDEFEIDDLDIREGIDFSCDVDHIGIFKATDNLNDRICFSDVGEKLVAEPFSFGGPFHNACNIDKGDSCGNDFFALREIR